MGMGSSSHPSWGSAETPGVSVLDPDACVGEEWSLEPYGLCRALGYVFKYETGCLCLTAVAMLTSNNWGVLNLVTLHYLLESKRVMDKEQMLATPAMQARLETLPIDVKLPQGKIVFRAIWLSKKLTLWLFFWGHPFAPPSKCR